MSKNIIFNIAIGIKACVVLIFNVITFYPIVTYIGTFLFFTSTS